MTISNKLARILLGKIKKMTSTSGFFWTELSAGLSLHYKGILKNLAHYQAHLDLSVSSKNVLEKCGTEPLRKTTRKTGLQ